MGCSAFSQEETWRSPSHTCSLSRQPCGFMDMHWELEVRRLKLLLYLICAGRLGQVCLVCPQFPSWIQGIFLAHFVRVYRVCENSECLFSCPSFSCRVGETCTALCWRAEGRGAGSAPHDPASEWGWSHWAYLLQGGTWTGETGLCGGGWGVAFQHLLFSLPVSGNACCLC